MSLGEMETRLLDLEIKRISDEGILEGYASVKNEIDAYGDVIVDGAYSNLPEFVRDGFVAVGHDHSSVPIGFVLEAKEDDHGLFVRMRFHSTKEAQAQRTVAQERMAAGKSVGLSIGYVALEWSWEDISGRRVRVLKKILVKEFSLVTMPAAQQALATGVKGGAGSRFDEQFASVLAALEDWKGRVERFAMERKQGLSEANRARVAAVRDACSALLSVGSAEAEDVLKLAHEWEKQISK